MKTWRIRQIFDGDYGCEERLPGQEPEVSVTLVNESGVEKYVSVEDNWLRQQGLCEGSAWPGEPGSIGTPADKVTESR